MRNTEIFTIIYIKINIRYTVQVLTYFFIQSIQVIVKKDKNATYNFKLYLEKQLFLDIFHLFSKHPQYLIFEALNC